MRKLNCRRSIVVFLLLLSGIGGGLAQPSYQNLAVLAGFDGSRPVGGLIRGQDGNFYGTTSRGGDFDKGTLFRVGPDGNGFETLHHFAGAPLHGDSPRYGTLARDGAGGYFGTTFAGGTADAGTLFRLDPGAPAPNVQILFAFPSTSAHPHAGVILAHDGLHLYGTTGEVVSNAAVTSHGSVFGIATDGSGFNVIHSFAGTDGSNPLAGVIEAGDGLLYGTTEKGGANGRGTLYRLARDGTAFQTLYHFPATGGSPVAGLLEGADGRLYGVAPSGGDGANPGGFLFSINRDGTGMQTLHSFSQGDNAGVAPTGGLVQAGDGGIYGTTRSGPDCPGSHCGSIFRYQPGGAFTTIHSFTDSALGASPEARLTLDASGNLYGSTTTGGVDGHGTVFVLALPRLDLAGPAQVDAGGTATYSLAMTNTAAILLAAPQTPALALTPALGLRSETADAWNCNAGSPGRFDCGWGADLAPGTSTGTHAWTFDVGSGPYAPGCGIGPSPCLAVTASDPVTGQTTQVLTPVALKRTDGTPNGFPRAVDDTATLYLPGDASVSINVLANDSDPEGDALAVGEIVTPPSAGTAVINGDGTVVYSPTNAVAGTDRFRYRVVDGTGASTTARVTVTSRAVGVNLSKSRLDIGNVPTGRLAAGRFWVDATPAPYHVDIRFANPNPDEIDAALTGTGYDRAQTQSDAAAFAANTCFTAPAETGCAMTVYFRPTAPAGKVSIARADLTLVDQETLRPMASRSVIVIGRSAPDSESPVVARDDAFTVGAGTASLVSPLVNDGTGGASLYFAGIGVCNFAPPGLAYAPCATHLGTTHTPVVGTSQVRITPASGFTGTNAFLYGVAREECVDTPGCRYENTIYYAVATVDVVPAAADLALALAAEPAAVEIGVPVAVTATITNIGPNPATGVSLSGLASLTGLNPVVTAPAGNCPAPPAGSPLECAFGNLAAGASATITLVVTPDQTLFPPESASVMVEATAMVSALEPDPAPENQQATVRFTVSRPPPPPRPPRISASFRPDADWEAENGAPFVFHIIIANAANAGPATGPVTVVDLLPEGLSFVAADSSPECTAAGREVTCAGASGLPPGRDYSFRIGTTVAVPGVGGPVGLTNRMTAIATPGDNPVPASDQTITVIRARPPRLSASFQPVASWEARDGDPFAFYIVVANAGYAGPATGPVTVVDALPEGLGFVAADSSPECTATGREVTCSGASGLPPGREHAFRIGTTVAVSGVGGPVALTNRMTAIATPDDNPVLAPDQTITVIRARPPRISASFQPVTSWEARDGVPFAFYIVIANAGYAGPTTGPVTVVDALPEGLGFVAGDSSPECAAVGQAVTCSGGMGLPGGLSLSFRIGTTVAVDRTRLPAQLVNRVTALSTPNDAPALPGDVTISVEASVGDTPVGQRVTVRPADAAGAPRPVVVSFAGVTAAGSTTATPRLAGFQPPPGFAIDGLVYDIATTAAYAAPVTVCFDGAFTARSVIQHGETDSAGGLIAWTILPNQRLLPAGPGPYNRICADSVTLSPFAVMQRLANEPAPTVSLRASGGPLTYGQALRLTAKVKGRSPGGTITFVDGETPLGYIPLKAGKANLRVSGLHAGIHTITANYSGDLRYNTSRSAPLRQVIKPSATRTRLRSSHGSAKAGQTLTLTASVKGNNPTGTVKFMEGSRLLGTGEVSHNQAILTGAGLAPGTHRIKAMYSGDRDHKPSISPVLKQRIH